MTFNEYYYGHAKIVSYFRRDHKNWEREVAARSKQRAALARQRKAKQAATYRDLVRAVSGLMEGSNV